MFHTKESNDYKTHKNSKKSNSTLTMLKYVEMSTVTANDENDFKMYIFPVFLHHFFRHGLQIKNLCCIRQIMSKPGKTQDFIQKNTKNRRKTHQTPLFKLYILTRIVILKRICFKNMIFCLFFSRKTSCLLSPFFIK